MNEYERMYFHGLAGNIIVINQEQLIIDTSLLQLEQIINTGGIYSRNRLKEHNIYYEHKPVENGNDYISVCVKNPNNEEFEGINEGLDSSFNSYVGMNKIALVISDSINNNHTFRNSNEANFLPGERQIKDCIELQYIIGITVMFENEEYQEVAVQRVNDLLRQYNINIPILDRNLNPIETQIKK